VTYGMKNGTNIINIHECTYIYAVKFTYSKLKYVGLAQVQPTNVFSWIIDSRPLIGKASVAAIPCSAAHFLS